MSRGRFLWHELMSNDVEKAMAFYSELLGWRFRRAENVPTPYWYLHDGRQTTGGVMECPPGAEMPSMWTPYVSVEDVDAATALAVELGCKVLVPPNDIPGTGRFSFVQDPQQAVIALLWLKEEMPEQDRRPDASEFCWYSLMTPNLEATLAFYNKLVGWTARETELGNGEKQVLFYRGEEMMADLHQMKEGDGTTAGWICSVSVANADVAREKALALGGQVWTEVTPVGSFGRFFLAADPTGAGLCYFQNAD